MALVGETTVGIVVAAYDTVVAARSTVRTAAERAALDCIVVDVDGAYRPVGHETVLMVSDVVSSRAARRRANGAAAVCEPADLLVHLAVAGAAQALARGHGRVVILGAGVLVLGDLGVLLDGRRGAVVLPQVDAANAAHRHSIPAVPVQHQPDTGLLTSIAPAGDPLIDRGIFILDNEDEVALLGRLTADWRSAPHALDTFAIAVGAAPLPDPALLVGPWRSIGRTDLDLAGRLSLDGRLVQAVDLSGLDARQPWTLNARLRTASAVLLSRDPHLARLVSTEAEARRADESRAGSQSGLVTPLRARIDDVLRAEARRVEHAGGELPDLLGLGEGSTLAEWALTLVPDGDPQPVARYLAAVRSARPDLINAFAWVPGRDSGRLARWARNAGVNELTHDPALLARAAEVTSNAQGPAHRAARSVRAEGVTVVGYLSAESGLGESARQVTRALDSAGVPITTLNVGTEIASRRAASYRRTDLIARRTALVCVNGAETSIVVPQLGRLLDDTRLIGMWYWELEDFPEGHRTGLQHVHEVWAATDFIRDAIARHAGDIPVRTVMPPLPQAGPDPGVVPERFGIPQDRPWFLFTFDFLSFAARKNPGGLIEAFTTAFADIAEPLRPLLVIKTINAGSRPGDAERLRLQISGRTDVMLLDAYLDDHERHVLVSHCTAYVSLHRAEGLGLTVAEAMAWGRPVITTAYGGVMQFCTPDNAFLVDWRRVRLEESVGPYDAGLGWAEPDLRHAAALIRAVLDEPERAASVGARAARDIRDLHNAEVAGNRMRAALEEGDFAWVAGEERGQTATPSDLDSAPTLAPPRGRLGRALARGRRRDGRRPA